ncbi:phage major capsid protein [Mycolicibacterium iranicum]|uniref:Phage major capsid protein n=1 Tax=Mycolicibacterium iranicum TaxID=912594 RepID=A0ABT4HJU5_MYCIR|nr:phage major capsid protein [Mycolicibacterium iranicum]MCZ0730477.1 phage major capsid protein [Mycolicibacterium iranicum]
MEQLLALLIQSRSRLTEERTDVLKRARDAGNEYLTDDEQHAFDALSGEIANLDSRIRDTEGEIARSGRGDPRVQNARNAQRGSRGVTEARDWAQRAADTMIRLGGENRAVVTGSFDVPQLIDPAVTPMARPLRLIDLLVNRTALTQGAGFEYFRQTVKTNNAAPVADLATKPTSINTVTPVQDRARVVAHLSEPAPVRLLQDAPALAEWLETEMAAQVLDALERQIVQGNGTGENFTGILSVAGTRQVAYTTDAPSTLRKALTVMQNAGESAINAIVLSPSDAEQLDLLRWGNDGAYLLPDALSSAPGGNIFGSSAITRVVSPSIPVGQAILGDWSKIGIYVREDVGVMIDASGELFTKNAFVMRAEGRFGVAHLRPSAFAVVDLVP